MLHAKFYAHGESNGEESWTFGLYYGSMQGCQVQGFPTVAFGAADGPDVRWDITHDTSQPQRVAAVTGNRGADFAIVVRHGQNECLPGGRVIMITSVLVRVSPGPGGLATTPIPPIKLCERSRVFLEPFHQA